MEKRQLGSSDLQITILGLGAWAIGGGDWEFGWGSQEDSDSISTIHEALDSGMNWIDTAPIYGLGRSETVVGKALKERKSDPPYVFTKCSMLWDDQRKIYRSLKAESVREECENSLRRLGIEAIDLYQIHWPNPEPDIEEGWATMTALKAEGKVRHIGVSNFSVEQIKRVEAVARPVTSLQPPYNLLSRGIEEAVLPYCHEENIGVIAYSPMASGLLTGAMTRQRIASFTEDDWRRNHPQYKEPKLSRNLELVELLRKIGSPHKASPGEVAIAWTLRHPAVTAAIVGLRKPGQIDGVIHAAEVHLSDEEAVEIEGFLEKNPA